MTPSQQRLVERLRAFGTPHVILHDHVFTRTGAIVSPESQACDPVSLTPAEGDQLLDALGGQLVQWTEGFRPDNAPGAWYSVIARRHLRLEDFNSKKRYALRQSLKRCSARPIAADELAAIGYPVHVNACRRYGRTGSALPTEEQFRRNVSRDRDYADILQHWGIFTTGEKLIGYATNRILGPAEVYSSSIRLDPEHLDCQPGYALMHGMTRHYLEEHGFAYLNDGFRSLYHETRVQEFLVSSFRFEKAYTTLRVHYRRPLRIAVAAAYPLRRLIAPLHPRMTALLALEDAHRHPLAPASVPETTETE